MQVMTWRGMRAWGVGVIVVVNTLGCSQVVQRLTIYSMGDMMAAGQRNPSARI
jgi:hypothetical protein